MGRAEPQCIEGEPWVSIDWLLLLLIVPRTSTQWPSPTTVAAGKCAIWARSTIRLTQSGSLWQSYVGNMSACIFATRLDRRDMGCIDN